MSAFDPKLPLASRPVMQGKEPKKGRVDSEAYLRQL
jgi:hypothetical protein